MAWFKRTDKGIKTSTAEKKDTPDGLWFKTPSGTIVHTRELKSNAYVSPNDDFHVKIGSKEYFEILFDQNTFTELDEAMKSGDPLNFVDTKSYSSRIEATISKTELNDAVRSAHGKMNGQELVIACMDFNFIGGSMGSVVGEKIARAIDHSLKHKIPFLMISKSGGARMMEAGFSLMQMAKTCGALARHAAARLPYISIMTHPTTGGVSASFATIGDVNLAEPRAMIGFAGPRVIRETTHQDLPAGFQTAEFLRDHGLIDRIVHRKEMRGTLSSLLSHLTPKR